MELLMQRRSRNSTLVGARRTAVASRRRHRCNFVQRPAPYSAADGPAGAFGAPRRCAAFDAGTVDGLVDEIAAVSGRGSFGRRIGAKLFDAAVGQ